MEHEFDIATKTCEHFESLYKWVLEWVKEISIEGNCHVIVPCKDILKWRLQESRKNQIVWTVSDMVRQPELRKTISGD